MALAWTLNPEVVQRPDERAVSAWLEDPRNGHRLEVEWFRALPSVGWIMAESAILREELSRQQEMRDRQKLAEHVAAMEEARIADALRRAADTGQISTWVREKREMRQQQRQQQRELLQKRETHMPERPGRYYRSSGAAARREISIYEGADLD